MNASCEQWVIVKQLVEIRKEQSEVVENMSDFPYQSVDMKQGDININNKNTLNKRNLKVSR